MRRILIIEDDPAIAEGLRAGLVAENYEVTVEDDGERGFRRACRDAPDLVILDLMLPTKNGEDVCADLRRTGRAVPVLMLTSKAEEADKVLGLELGADDYMTKPFSLRELLARVHALLRRAPTLQEPEEFSVGDLWVGLRTREVLRAGQPATLTAREFEILRYFIRHRNEVVTRDMLLDEVWGYEHFPTTRTVDNFILSLRKKIEADPANPALIVTVHTAGYRFTA